MEIAESKGHLDAAMLLSQAEGSIREAIREAMREGALRYDLDDVRRYVEGKPTFDAVVAQIPPDLRHKLIGMVAAAMLVATQIERLDHVERASVERQRHP